MGLGSLSDILAASLEPEFSGDALTARSESVALLSTVPMIALGRDHRKVNKSKAARAVRQPPAERARKPPSPDTMCHDKGGQILEAIADHAARFVGSVRTDCERHAQVGRPYSALAPLLERRQPDGEISRGLGRAKERVGRHSA